MVQATKNGDRCWIFTAPFASQMNFKVSSSPAACPLTITLRQVWERIPNLHLTFENVFSGHSCCYPAFIFNLERDGGGFVDIELFPTRLGLPDEAAIRDAFHLSPDVTLSTGGFGTLASRFRYAQGEFVPVDAQTIRFRLAHDSEEERARILDRVKNDEEGGIFLVAPLPDDVRLSSLSLLFMASFAIGMLARYYPSVWQSLAVGGQGDSVFPLIRATVSAVARRFPELVLMEIEDRLPGLVKVA